MKHGVDFLGFHTYLTESGAVIRKSAPQEQKQYEAEVEEISRPSRGRDGSTERPLNNPIKAGEDTPKRKAAIT
ncbi:MAG: hypothetical protein ACLR1P_07725 [Oscillospiraceae bacterium]